MSAAGAALPSLQQMLAVLQQMLAVLQQMLAVRRLAADMLY
jgi:hypothetical protein